MFQIIKPLIIIKTSEFMFYLFKFNLIYLYRKSDNILPGVSGLNSTLSVATDFPTIFLPLITFGILFRMIEITVSYILNILIEGIFNF